MGVRAGVRRPIAHQAPPCRGWGSRGRRAGGLAPPSWEPPRGARPGDGEGVAGSPSHARGEGGDPLPGLTLTPHGPPRNPLGTPRGPPKGPLGAPSRPSSPPLRRGFEPPGRGRGEPPGAPKGVPVSPLSSSSSSRLARVSGLAPGLRGEGCWLSATAGPAGARLLQPGIWGEGGAGRWWAASQAMGWLPMAGATAPHAAIPPSLRAPVGEDGYEPP